MQADLYFARGDNGERLTPQDLVDRFNARSDPATLHRMSPGERQVIRFRPFLSSLTLDVQEGVVVLAGFHVDTTDDAELHEDILAVFEELGFRAPDEIAPEAW